MADAPILVTGGAGFIGSHLADLLLARGYEVRVLDSLVPQVHGEGRAAPGYLDPAVDLLHGDVRNPVLIRRALERVDAVVHLAAAVGVAKVPSIKAALAGRVINGLITDEATARAVLDR